MPIYNPYISAPRLSAFGRLAYHSKSINTNSPAAAFDHGNTTTKKSASKRAMFSSRSSFDAASSAKSSIKSIEAATISMKIESPPLVFFGPPKESTGALLSGLIHLKNDSGKEWASFTMALQSETVYKRPVHSSCADCADCAAVVDVVSRWTFITAPSDKGLLTYPFSHLLPGHLPATNNNALAKISYSLVATATSVDGEEINFREPISLERSILPGPERHSIRVFPPTKLSAAIELPSVVHPGGNFAFDLRLDGVVWKEHSSRWCLRKVIWRIDERAHTVSPGCKHHQAKLGAAAAAAKGVLHEDTRIVGFGEVKRGWKSDFDSPDGKIELQVQAGIPAYNNAACDLDVADGTTTAATTTTVDHVMVIEMVVAEEHRPVGPNKPVTPTGAARVIRMQFPLVVTARSGLGISWDEEAPPVYDDVPASPPNYGSPNASPTLSYADVPPMDDSSSADSLLHL